jgi:hypothetical protein
MYNTNFKLIQLIVPTPEPNTTWTDILWLNDPYETLNMDYLSQLIFLPIPQVHIYKIETKTVVKICFTNMVSTSKHGSECFMHQVFQFSVQWIPNIIH